MLNKLVAMLVIIASTELILAQAQNGSPQFPAPNGNPWELPSPPSTDAFVPTVHSHGLARNVAVGAPKYGSGNADFMDVGPNVEGSFAKSVLAPAMGVRTDATDWQQMNNNPSTKYGSSIAEPLYYRPTMAYVGGVTSAKDLPGTLTIPQKPYLQATTQGSLPPSWDILVDPVVPLPPLLPQAPQPPKDPQELALEQQQANAVLMELQAKTASKQKMQMLQEKSAELAKLRASVQAVPMKTVTTTTYYSNPMETVLKQKEAALAQAQAEYQEQSSFLETKNTDATETPKPRVAGKIQNYRTDGKRLSYNRFKRDYILHNNPLSNSAMYEINQLGNRVPSETLDHHLPAGWREQSFVDNFTGIKPEDKIVNTMGNARRLYNNPVVVKNKTLSKSTATTVAAPKVNATTPVVKKTSAKVASVPVAKPVVSSNSTKPVLTTTPPAAPMKAPLAKEVVPKPLVAKPIATADAPTPVVVTPIAVPSSFLETEHYPSRRYHSRYLRHASRRFPVRRPYSPRYHMLAPRVVSFDRLHPVHSPSGRHIGYTPRRAALRSASREPVVQLSTVPKTRMGMLAEFVRMNKAHPATKVIRRNNALPFGGSFIETEEEPMISNERPHGVPRRTSMRAAPRQ